MSLRLGGGEGEIGDRHLIGVSLSEPLLDELNVRNLSLY